jgi:hypothetical protein
MFLLFYPSHFLVAQGMFKTMALEGANEVAGVLTDLDLLMADLQTSRTRTVEMWDNVGDVIHLIDRSSSEQLSSVRTETANMLRSKFERCADAQTQTVLEQRDIDSVFDAVGLSAVAAASSVHSPAVAAVSHSLIAPADMAAATAVPISNPNTRSSSPVSASPARLFSLPSDLAPSAAALSNQSSRADLSLTAAAAPPSLAEKHSSVTAAATNEPDASRSSSPAPVFDVSDPSSSALFESTSLTTTCRHGEVPDRLPQLLVAEYALWRKGALALAFAAFVAPTAPTSTSTVLSLPSPASALSATTSTSASTASSLVSASASSSSSQTTIFLTASVDAALHTMLTMLNDKAACDHVARDRFLGVASTVFNSSSASSPQRSTIAHTPMHRQLSSMRGAGDDGDDDSAATESQSNSGSNPHSFALLHSQEEEAAAAALAEEERGSTAVIERTDTQSFWNFALACVRAAFDGSTTSMTITATTLVGERWRDLVFVILHHCRAHFAALVHAAGAHTHRRGPPPGGSLPLMHLPQQSVAASAASSLILNTTTPAASTASSLTPIPPSNVALTFVLRHAVSGQRVMFASPDGGGDIGTDGAVAAASSRRSLKSDNSYFGIPLASSSSVAQSVITTSSNEAPVPTPIPVVADISTAATQASVSPILDSVLTTVLPDTPAVARCLVLAHLLHLYRPFPQLCADARSARLLIAMHSVIRRNAAANAWVLYIDDGARVACFEPFAPRPLVELYAGDIGCVVGQIGEES